MSFSYFTIFASPSLLCFPYCMTDTGNSRTFLPNWQGETVLTRAMVSYGKRRWLPEIIRELTEPVPCSLCAKCTKRATLDDNETLHSHWPCEIYKKNCTRNHENCLFCGRRREDASIVHARAVGVYLHIGLFSTSFLALGPVWKYKK